MSKAILVIDMPDDCSMCPCFQYGEDNYCAATGETNYSYKCARPTDCPLTSIPEKQIEDYELIEHYKNKACEFIGSNCDKCEAMYERCDKQWCCFDTVTRFIKYANEYNI